MIFMDGRIPELVQILFVSGFDISRIHDCSFRLSGIQVTVFSLNFSFNRYKRLMQEGFMLLLVGMGTVFTFLIVLVLCLQLSSRFFQRFGHHFADSVMESAVEDESEYLAVAIAATHAASSTPG
jgi:sodium pump decarboxylase gamma subunit